MKITRRKLRRLINEVYKDYESQKRGERARLGIQQKLKSLEDSGEYEDRLMANQLALAMGSKELELPTKPLKINFEFEMIKNKARAYLQSTLDFCEWVNSSDERFTSEDKETIKQMHQSGYDLSQEYYRSLRRLYKKLGEPRQVSDQGYVTFGDTQEQHEFYMKLADYVVRPFDDHSSLLADIARDEPKYAWMGRPVKPGKCRDMYSYRMFGPRKF